MRGLSGWFNQVSTILAVVWQSHIEIKRISFVCGRVSKSMDEQAEPGGDENVPAWCSSRGSVFQAKSHWPPAFRDNRTRKGTASLTIQRETNAVNNYRILSCQLSIEIKSR